MKNEQKLHAYSARAQNESSFGSQHRSQLEHCCSSAQLKWRGGMAGSNQRIAVADRVDVLPGAIAQERHDNRRQTSPVCSTAAATVLFEI